VERGAAPRRGARGGGGGGGPRWTSDSRETNANADARIFRITPRG